MTKSKTKYDVETIAKCLTDKAEGDAGATAFQTFMGEDVEVSNGYMIPYHAVCAVKVKTSTEKVEVDDSTCKGSDTPEPPVPSVPPTIDGVGDVQVQEGDTFDPMEGVSATDADGNPASVTVSGTVDTDVPGEYTLTYTATDSKGNTATTMRKVTVVAQSVPIINGVNDVTIKQGVGIDLTEGVTASVDGKDIEFTVDPTEIAKCEVGVHDVTYTATNKKKTTTVVRKVTIETIDNPTIEGLSDIEVEVGEEFDPLEGVTAKDGNGNDVEVEIVSDADEWVLKEKYK